MFTEPNKTLERKPQKNKDTKVNEFIIQLINEIEVQ